MTIHSPYDQASFTRIVQDSRKAKAFRDSLITDVNRRTLAPIPATSDPKRKLIVTNVAHEERAAMIGRNVRALVRRHTHNLKMRHSGMNQCYADHADYIKRQRGTWGVPHVIKSREERCSDWRGIVAFIRNSVIRERIAAGQMLVNGQVVQMPLNPEDKEGMQVVRVKRGYRVSGAGEVREVRVNVRGAYGKRGIRGTAARVSQRDAYAPTWALLPFLTVGVATHPDATARDYDQLLLAIRREPSLATLRRYTPDNLVGDVVAVSEYTKASDAPETPETRRVVVAQEVMSTPEVVKLAATVGYITSADAG